MIVIPAYLESFRRIADKPQWRTFMPLRGDLVVLPLCNEVLGTGHEQEVPEGKRVVIAKGEDKIIVLTDDSDHKNSRVLIRSKRKILTDIIHKLVKKKLGYNILAPSALICLNL